MTDTRYDVTTAEGVRHRDAETTRRRIPPRYREAVATEAKITAWCDHLAAGSAVPSLLITGPTGAGKTWQAYGAIRRITAAASVPWLGITAADLRARLRPGDDTDPEGELARYASVPLLLLDDVGAAKDSEWTEEADYRLVNARSAALLPTIFTTNLPVRAGNRIPSLESALSERVFSRLAECQVVTLKGADRRRA